MAMKFIVKAYGEKSGSWRAWSGERVKGKFVGVLYQGVFLSKDKALVKAGELKCSGKVLRVSVEGADDKNRAYDEFTFISSGWSKRNFDKYDLIYDWRRAGEEWRW